MRKKIRAILNIIVSDEFYLYTSVGDMFDVKTNGTWGTLKDIEKEIENRLWE